MDSIVSIVRNGEPPPARPDRREGAEVVAALSTPEVKGYMANASIEALGSTPAEFGTFFRAERDTWARMIQTTGAKLD